MLNPALGSQGHNIAIGRVYVPCALTGNLFIRG